MTMKHEEDCGCDDVEALDGVERPNYEELDPGIRGTVRWLNDRFFETTDSGDGFSKFKDDDFPKSRPELIPFPHVIMVVPSIVLIDETDRLAELINSAGLKVLARGPELTEGEINIDATYDPAQPEDGIIMLFGLNDEMLRSKGVI